jgi:hypothetical protein
VPLTAAPFGLIGSQMMKFYSDPLTQIGCVMWVSGGANLNCVITGYFVDVH